MWNLHHHHQHPAPIQNNHHHCWVEEGLNPGTGKPPSRAVMSAINIKRIHRTQLSTGMIRLWRKNDVTGIYIPYTSHHQHQHQNRYKDKKQIVRNRMRIFSSQKVVWQQNCPKSQYTVYYTVYRTVQIYYKIPFSGLTPSSPPHHVIL